MKKSIILELVASGDCYFDDINMADSEEYKKCLSEVRDLLKEFCKGMTENEREEIMWKFETAQGGLEAATANKFFKEGFKLGLTIAAQNFLD